MQGLDLIMIAAFRYAIGRQTYIVKTVADFIKTNHEKLSKDDKRIIINEIGDAKKNNGLGSPFIEAKEWIELKKFLEDKEESDE